MVNTKANGITTRLLRKYNRCSCFEQKGGNIIHIMINHKTTAMNSS